MSLLARCLWCLCLCTSLSAAPLVCQTTSTEERAGLGRRFLTVADAIRTTRLADAEYGGGTPSIGRVAQFSPDGKRFAIVLVKGSLESNTNEFSIALYETSNAFAGPRPNILLRMSSSSNRPAISRIKWLEDNDTITFLGEKIGELPQVYALHAATRRLNQLTHHPSSVVDYDMNPNGDVVFIADPPKEKILDTDKARRDGIVITTQFLQNLLAGDCAPPVTNREQLFLQKKGQSPVQIATKDFIFPGHPYVSLSPGGRYALVRTWVGGSFPGWWADYQVTAIHDRVKAYRYAGEMLPLMRFLVLDLADGSLSPLLDTPMEWYNETATWSPDGRFVFLSTYLPLNVRDEAERAQRAKSLYDVQVALPEREITKLRTVDFETVLKQETKRRRKGSENEDLDVSLVEDLNTPPMIYVSDRRAVKKALLLDLNPQFSELNLGKVELVEWSATDGHVVEGGLYWPEDYERGKRYPLVMQTHGFDSHRFSTDGLNEWSSAFAARPLAGEGFFVLQMGRSKVANPSVGNTPQEYSYGMAEVEGAIDDLDKQGLIDRERVGIVGFSRTEMTVGYALTHSKYHFAAGSLVDGTNGGYFEYLAYPTTDDMNRLNGGPGYGEGLQQWLKNAPPFNLDKVRTPVRLLAFGFGSVLEQWEWFTLLRKMQKPVEFLYLPDAVHLVVKPWERMVAQQGLVDWFRFWLKGEEDSNPVKAPQYARWRELRKLLMAQVPADTGAARK